MSKRKRGRRRLQAPLPPSTPTTTPAAGQPGNEGERSRASVPKAPIGGQGGQGDYYPEHGTGELMDDLGIVAKALFTPLYPVRSGSRQALVDWVDNVFATVDDIRAKTRAGQLLVAIDGHNLTLVRLRLEEQRLKLEERRLGLGQQQGTGPGITVIIEGEADKADVPGEGETPAPG